ncbi:MAG: M56 family metallopeptidase, partial [Lachnospiraceae bacterium]
MISNFILMYLITTTFTGSVAFAIWYFLEQKFDRHKLDALLYYSLKFVILLFLIPLLLLPYLFPYPFASPWEFGTIATRAFNCALACVWVVGAIKTLVCIVKNEHEHSVMENTYFEASDIHKQLLEEVKAELHIKRKIEIYVGEERQSPFMRGIIRPRIFMPTNIQSPQDITYSLHHELTHYLHHDLWMLFLLNVLHVIHWFNPIIPQLAPFLKKWTEIYVDCTVSSPKRLGNSYTKFLIRLLLSYQEDAQKQQAVKAQQISPAVGMSEEDHKKKIDTAKRIDRLIDRPKYTTLKKRIVIGLLMLGIGGGVIALSVFWNGIEFGSRTAYEELVVKEEE